MQRPLLALLLLASPLRAQHPLRHVADGIELRFARSQPVVSYELRVDPGDRTGFAVEMRIRNVPDTFRIAMVAHPEYDDRYWRYVERLTVIGPKLGASIVREDSALWRVFVPGAARGEAIVRWRIGLPEPPAGDRASWRPFLAPTGGLIGGPHAFMYVVGATLAPSHVTLALPEGWRVATGLAPTSDPRVFFAPTVDALVDGPILVGALRDWRFAIDGVPHRVAWWPRRAAAPFDTAALVRGVEGLARQAVALFGRAPYREYVFLYQDGAYGGLEHANSVTLGTPSDSSAERLAWALQETAHEFVHAWNLVRIRPAERGDVSWRQTGQSPGLWFSEGLTMFYADLLARRAGVPVPDSTRLAHLTGLMTRYWANAGNTRVSPERASLAEYGAAPGSLGDYDPSPHLQGELLGTMLDLMVRDATAGRRSMDDVMRAMLERFSGERGFTGRDIERTVAGVCGCDVSSFFEAHVRRGTPIDFDRWLRLAGLRARVTWSPALGREGQPAPDLRLWGWNPPGDGALLLRVTDPESAWGRAGLHTNDRLLSMNGAAVTTWPEMRAVLTRLRVGDTVGVEVARPSGRSRVRVTVTGYDVPAVRIEELPGATERQRTLRERWMRGDP